MESAILHLAECLLRSHLSCVISQTPREKTGRALRLVRFCATEIYEAERGAVLAALGAPGSNARNQRGALPITKFKAIGHLRWQSTARRAEPAENLRRKLGELSPE
jgi:hypothetical protein